MEVVGASASGRTFARIKKTFDDTQIAVAEAATLKTTLERGGEDFRPSQKEMTSVSSTTVIVAAGAPNSRAAAKTKVSDTDSLAGMPGTLTVNEPLRRVKSASINHRGSSGARESSRSECRTTVAPTATTIEMYKRLESRSSCCAISVGRSVLVSPNNQSAHCRLLER